MELYKFVGGPLDGQEYEFYGTATWWGMTYEDGEYNTVPCCTDGCGTYKAKPSELYWTGPGRTHWPAEWQLSEPVEDTSGETLEEHIQRLLDEQDEG